MTPSTLLILGAGEELIPLIEISKGAGYRVVATDRSPAAPGLKAADEGVVLDGTNLKRVLELAVEHRIAGITTRTEVLLPVVSEVCDKLGLPGPSRQVSDMSVDKLLFRTFMQQAGLATPLFFSPATDREVLVGLEGLQLPVVVKPVDHGGSTGVSLATTTEEALLGWKRAREASPSDRVIVEEMVSGREYSVETWSQGGKTHIAAITEKRVSNNGHFVELGHTIPAVIKSPEREAIVTEVGRMATAMQLDNCLTHTEVVLTSSSQAILLETGARPGGDLIGLKLVEMATGINMYRIMMHLATGRHIQEQVPLSHGAAIRFVTTHNKEVVRRRHDTFIRHTHFVDYKELLPEDPGRLTSSADRLGYYLFRAACPEALNQTLQLFDEI